jgi:hypothetical protein
MAAAARSNSTRRDPSTTASLHPTATVNGNVFGGPATDTPAFGGTGTGTFDLGLIDTGAGTQQYQNFEVFDVDSGTWSFSGATTVPFTVDAAP